MFHLFDTIDSIFSFCPAAVRVGACGFLLGVLSMLIYHRLAPQKRIDKLKVVIADAQLKLRRYNGTDPRQMLRLAGGTISPALKQFLYVAGPTLVAILPVLWIADWLDKRFSQRSMYSVGPHWCRSWEVPFTVALSMAAIVMKMILKPKTSVDHGQ